MADSTPLRAHHVQPVLLVGEEEPSGLDRALRDLLAVTRRAPLLVSHRRRLSLDTVVTGTTTLLCDADPFSACLLAAMQCRARGRDVTLLVVTADAATRLLQDKRVLLPLASAARAAKGVVFGTGPVDWSTRGAVFEPAGSRNAHGTSAIHARSWIADERELDQHLEIGTAHRPTGALAVDAARLLAHSFVLEGKLARRCSEALGAARRRGRRIEVADAPNGERPMEDLADLFDVEAARVLRLPLTDMRMPASVRPQGRTVAALRARSVAAGHGLADVGTAPVRSLANRPRKSFGMIWRLP